MNCLNIFEENTRDKGDAIAFVSPDSRPVSFKELRELVARVQSSLIENGFKSKDTALLATDVSIELYAIVLAIMGLGGSVVLVEPWMPIKNIAQVIRLVSPKIFISSLVGNLWGARIKEIREIPHWVKAKTLTSGRRGEIIAVDVDAKTPGIITFTSGTSGVPKGVVREQGYMLRQLEVLKKALHSNEYKGSDLCIFANWTLLNLAQAKPTVFFPPNWSKKNFLWLNQAAQTYNIDTLTSGPAFMSAMIEYTSPQTLKNIHIGGALTSCDFFEQLFKKFPAAHISQVYGSSEVEPVCLVDAKISVKKSREKDYFHSLFLGHPIDEITFSNDDSGMWVTGPHVCEFYLNNQKENELNKKRDEMGRIWHFMGDRIDIDNEKNWWYMGRSQNPNFFQTNEERIYQIIKNDSAFLFLNEKNELSLAGENIKSYLEAIKKIQPNIVNFYQSRIIKDKRHRARIDRKASIEKAKKI